MMNIMKNKPLNIYNNINKLSNIIIFFLYIFFIYFANFKQLHW